MSRTIRSLGVEAPLHPYLLHYDEHDLPPGHVRLETLYTGLSAGTELTFLKATNPYLHSRFDAGRGVFVAHEPGARFPVPFLGYMEVGRVIASDAPDLPVGAVVAGTWAHKTGHTADPFHEMLVPLPAGMDPVLGIFVAQMGPIAANGILHADAEMFGAAVPRLGASLARKVAFVFGAGTVGLMTALFARRAGAAQVIVTDPSAWRRDKARAMGFTAMTEDEAWTHAKARLIHAHGERGADVVFQTRADAGSLHAALKALRPQGSVIDMAFYQGGAEPLRLGEEFHHNGLSIRCAQIGRVPRGLAPAWDRARLAQETLALLAEEGNLIRDAMITHVVPFDDGPAFLERLVAERPDFLQVVFQVAP